ncbi:MAG: ABC transporter ATP-binding protein [Deltaproteobacteria bacterium]|jgi:ABC-2 type transport system ATP-binding protein|nr:ABC transporter ATP-binding protein [Deltaproteobacteria bacterium]MBW2533649.1 ABC transporter ATP-binding protein [Deltaproteobacteria bacterium]
MSEPDEELAIVCEGLVKHYDDVVAVDGLDLEILRGECFGLLGPNGAGKTTTVEILEGLTPPTSGSVGLLGCRWGTGCDTELRGRIGIQLQETQLADKLTVEETIRLFRSFYPRGRAPDDVIDLLELDAKRSARVYKLSGGQRQRLALATALVSQPEILFLDEPTTGLDPQARRRIWDVVQEFSDGGGTTLLTTHYMEEAAQLCDRVAIMDSGRIIAQGTPDELIASLEADQLIELTPEERLVEDELATLPAVAGVQVRDRVYVLAVSEIGRTLPALTQYLETRGVGIVTLTTRQPTLEDVFVSLTGRGLRDD